MKIKKIKFEGHPILRDYEFNFTNSVGEVFDTILIVGENGSGKTTFLDFLSNVQYFFQLW